MLELFGLFLTPLRLVFLGAPLTSNAATAFTVRFINSIKEIDRQLWSSLAGDDNPFLRYEFLLALEESDCTSSASGWQPFHCLLELAPSNSLATDEQTHTQPFLIALLPSYLKTNSTGEYVFDWGWADAYQQHGLDYYPKLLSAIPFTPSAGPRLCIHPDYDTADIIPILAKLIPQTIQTLNITGWHVLFPEIDPSRLLQQQGIQQRIGCQYQWFNYNFNSFEHFLENFTSRKRKNIRKERNKIISDGIQFLVIEGADITQSHWQQFYRFYQSTYHVRGRHPYLNQAFFEHLGQSMPENLLLIMATKDNEYIAGALSFKSNDTLYGRYWGCTEEYQFLHFETCYYQGIEYCITHQLKRFDSGAQGEHKIQRGFEPVLTYSNHWLAHPQFNHAITAFLLEEEKYTLQHIERAKDFLPFKKATGKEQ